MGKLEKVVIPANITEILDEAFRSSGLEVIEFENNSKLASIGGKAFISCNKLKEIVIPHRVTEILYAAFLWSALEVIEFEAGSKLTSIDGRAFHSTPIVYIKIPQGVKEI